MKFKKYIKTLNKFVKKHPEAKNFNVITSKDDEGNGYNRVHYSPTIGYYDVEGQEFENTGRSEPDSVCIN